MSNRSGILGIVVEHNAEATMRDGTVLRANVYRPDDDARYPGLLTRTPYDKDQEGLGLARYEPYVRAGYAVVVQDSRGRFDSDGDFIPQYVAETHDAEDGYDSVEWLATQSYCDGNVGVVGNSYNAWMGWMLAKMQPPHLKAMSSYACPFEWSEVDFPGAFRPGRRLHWLRCHMAPDIRRRRGLPGPHTYEEANRLWQELEHGRLLHLLPYSLLPDYLPPGLKEYVAAWFEQPAARPWRFDQSHARVTVPNLDFTGWFDHCVSSIKHLTTLQKIGATDTARRDSKVVLGPWNHGGVGKRLLGEFDFGLGAGMDMHLEIIRWFDHWLKGLDNGTEAIPAVRYYVIGSGHMEGSALLAPFRVRAVHLFPRCRGRWRRRGAVTGADAGTCEPGESGRLCLRPSRSGSHLVGTRSLLPARQSPAAVSSSGYSAVSHGGADSPPGVGRRRQGDPPRDIDHPRHRFLCPAGRRGSGRTGTGGRLRHGPRPLPERSG